jgi:hypothetical protein
MGLFQDRFGAVVMDEPSVGGGALDRRAYRLCHPNVLPMETAEPSD